MNLPNNAQLAADFPFNLCEWCGLGGLRPTDTVYAYIPVGNTEPCAAASPWMLKMGSPSNVQLATDFRHSLCERGWRNSTVGEKCLARSVATAKSLDNPHAVLCCNCLLPCLHCDTKPNANYQVPNTKYQVPSTKYPFVSLQPNTAGRFPYSNDPHLLLLSLFSKLELYMILLCTLLCPPH